MSAMDNEDRIAQGLENGNGEGLTGAEREHIANLRGVLGEDFTWEQPPSDLGERIDAAIEEGSSPARNRWLWVAAAALILVVGTVAVITLTDDPGPSPVAVMTVSGTDLAPDAAGTAELIPTPNGWAIAFDVTGLEPAPQGTFYQGWVSNGAEGISVGTFHMRGDEPTPIGLWSGVDLHEYRTLNITIQEVGGGQVSSGVLVMTGTAESFDDE